MTLCVIRQFRTTARMLGLAVALAFCSLAATYDAVSNFSATSNPNGPWSYGWEASLGGAFTLNAVTDDNGSFPGIDLWLGPDSTIDVPYLYPLVAFNHTGSTVNYGGGVYLPANMLSLHPSYTGKFSVVRWTAPTTGSFRVVGLFQGIDVRSTSTDVHVLQNSATSLLSASINGYFPTDGGSAQVTFNFTRFVAAGETIDFAVGVGLDGRYDGDSTGLAVTIAPAYTATIQPPIGADGSSVFNANRGVVPVKFALSINGTPTCQLPPATISVVRTSGAAAGPVNESDFVQSSDTGSNFRIDTANCQYVYNIGTRLLGAGTYEVRISIDGAVVGSGTFGLQ